MAFYAMSRSMWMVQLALEKAPYKSFGNYPSKETGMQEEIRKGNKRKALQSPNYIEETELPFQSVYDEMTRDESLFQPASYKQKIFNNSAIQPVFDDGDEVISDAQNLLGEVDEILRTYDVNEIDVTYHPNISESESRNNAVMENLDVIEDDSEARNDEVPMNNDGVIEKDDRPAEKKKHDLKPPYFCKMRKCHEKISEESRIYVHDEFWTLNYKDRNQWICSHVMEVHPLVGLQMKTVAETLPVSIFFQIL